MKQLKRLLVFALLVSVVGTFTACGNRDKNNGTTVEETDRADVSPSPETHNNKDTTDNGNDSNMGNDNNNDGAVDNVVEDVGDGVEQGVDGVINGVENVTDDMTDGGDHNNNSASPTPTAHNKK